MAMRAHIASAIASRENLSEGLVRQVFRVFRNLLQPRYLTMACKAAEQASPYFHPRVSTGLADSDVLAYVARLPSPIEDSEQWAKESNPRPKRPQ